MTAPLPEPVSGRWSWARRLRPGSLRVRLLLAFTAVAVTAIALVTAAALVGTTRGLSAQQDDERRALAERVAAGVADAYRRAGGWDGVDLRPSAAVAAGGNAALVVRDGNGGVLLSTAGRGRMGNGPGAGNGSVSGNGPGMGNGSGYGPGQGAGYGAGAGAAQVRAAVTVDGVAVGTLTLLFPGGATPSGQPVAWTWVGVAAVTAVLLALAAAWLITRMLTRPLAALTATARAFAAGDRSVRTGVRAPGELGALASAFDDAAARVQLAETARRQMSADVAHELRTPLAALQAGLEELRDGLAPADAEALSRLHDQTLRLGRVVSDLADLSAADAARLTLRPAPVDLVTVATAAADVQQAPLRAAGITLTRELDDSVVVRGDADRLHQVVANLLQNCVRHCRPGDRVTLAVHATAAEGTARLSVTDTGPGIRPEDLPHVFTRFWRSGSGGGSGLGMPIVRSIVEAHGGRVSVSSDGRSGTSVRVDLPLAARPRTGTGQPAASSGRVAT